MNSDFKDGDPAKYIGRIWARYTGSTLTVTSDLLYGKVRQPNGLTLKMYYHRVRFFDGYEISPQNEFLAVPPKDLRRIDDPYIDEEFTDTELELEI